MSLISLSTPAKRPAAAPNNARRGPIPPRAATPPTAAPDAALGYRLQIPPRSVPLPPDTTFRLRKWYLDAVAPDGRAVIAYWAHVRWMALSIRYASTLTLDPNTNPSTSAPRQRTTLRAGPPPAIDPASGVIAWCSPTLDLRARFEPAADPIARTLLRTDAGAVEWSCLMPRAHALIERSGHEPVRALGYVERLDLTIPPWRLPLRSLRWGRFLSEHAGLVWIQWTGEQPRDLLFDCQPSGPAREAPAPIITDTRITSSTTAADTSTDPDTTVLDLHSPRTLRDGPLGATALANLPGAHRLIPGAILNAHETKWLSRGHLRRAPHHPHAPHHPESTSPQPTVEGWAIHELVHLSGAGS